MAYPYNPMSGGTGTFAGFGSAPNPMAGAALGKNPAMPVPSELPPTTNGPMPSQLGGLMTGQTGPMNMPANRQMMKQFLGVPGWQSYKQANPGWRNTPVISGPGSVTGDPYGGGKNPDLPGAGPVPPLPGMGLPPGNITTPGDDEARMSSLGTLMKGQGAVGGNMYGTLAAR